MNKKIVGSISVIAGILLILTPNYLAPVCPPMEDGRFMKCHWMGNITMGIGALVLVLAIIFILSKDVKFSLGISVGSIAFGVLELLNAHKLIGGCMKADMSCNAKTIPFATIVAVVLIIANIYYYVKERNA